MFPRTEYEMTPDQEAMLLKACQPVPYMVVGGMSPRSPQENANHAWAALGREMGFDGMTVRPSNRGGRRFFTAIPSETAAARQEREATEATVRRDAEAARLRKVIEEAQAKLHELTAMPEA
jgi:hypothetical protein